jgi:prevent-host-death family protein
MPKTRPSGPRNSIAITPPLRSPIDAVAARRWLGQLMNRVEYGRERIRISRRGRVIAVLVPVDQDTSLGATPA